MDFDAQVGLDINSVSSLANYLLASSSCQSRSSLTFSLNAGLAVSGWNSRLITSLDAGRESVKLDHVEASWASGSDALTSGKGVEFVANNLLTNSVFSELRSGLAGLLDTSGPDKVFSDLASNLNASVSLLDFSGLALLGTLSVNSQNLVDWAGNSNANSFSIVIEVFFASSSASDVSDESFGRCAVSRDADLSTVFNDSLFSRSAD